VITAFDGLDDVAEVVLATLTRREGEGEGEAVGAGEAIVLAS